MFEFLVGNNLLWFFIILGFLGFIFIMLKAVKLFIKTVFAGLILGFVPFIINNIFGISGFVELSLSTSFNFMIFGMLLYLIYEIIRIMISASIFTGKVILVPLNILIFIGNSVIWIFTSIYESIFKKDKEPKNKEKHDLSIEKQDVSERKESE
ncbi:MAG: hypothetical protein K0B02_02205 [DPANN group archaeon]|nr:hypothetical protein [DPANN group archaeon]